MSARARKSLVKDKAPCEKDTSNHGWQLHSSQGELVDIQKACEEFHQ
jgi:hypothetical protein